VESTLLIYVKNGKASGFSSPASDKELRMRTGNCLQYFRIRKSPFFIGRVPGPASKRLVDIAMPVKQLKKLSDTELPPFREVLMTRKSSWRAASLQARLSLSGDNVVSQS
jgi:hypothetical protein